MSTPSSKKVFPVTDTSCLRLLRYLMDCFHEGHVKPIHIAQVTSASATQEACRYMQQGKHIGKIVLQLRNDAGKLEVGEVSPVKKGGARLDSTASYLIVGGLGGLGRAISVWMVQSGARNLIFLSRSAGKGSRDQDFVKELESMACSVELVQGDVTNIDDVGRAMDNARAPLRGIIQMSMVLRDQPFDEMSFEDWNAANLPKTNGTLHLHQAALSRKINLDLFVLFSSLSGFVGQPGQANYASANTFLDAFAQYRESLGLPCTTIALGAMEGIGYLSEHQDLLRKMQGTGWRAVQEAELLEGLQAAIMPHSQDCFSERGTASFMSKRCLLLGLSPTIPLSSPDSNTRLRRDVRMAVFHNFGSKASKMGSGDDEMRSFLKSAKADPSVLQTEASVHFLAGAIGKKLFSLLLKSDEEVVNIKMNTADIGLDSLIAGELRSWWKATLGHEVSVLELLNAGPLEALGKLASERLFTMYDK